MLQKKRWIAKPISDGGEIRNFPRQESFSQTRKNKERRYDYTDLYIIQRKKMKKVLSSLIALILAISTTSFAAFHVSYVFKGTGPDGKTYNYFFGWFDEGDQEVGLTIDGKDYVLEDEAYAKAVLNGNKCGIGIHSEEDFTAIPYAVDAESTRTEGTAVNIEASAPETVVTYDLLPQEIKLDGELIETFQKERNYYYVTVNNDTVPQITAVKNSASASVNVTVQQASAVPGTATVTLSDPYGNQNVITIYLEKPGEYQEKEAPALVSSAKVTVVSAEDRTFSYTPNFGFTSSIKSAPNGQLRADHSYAVLEFDISQLNGFSGKAVLSLGATVSAANRQGYLGAFGVDMDHISTTKIESSAPVNEADFAANNIPSIPDSSDIIDRVYVNEPVVTPYPAVTLDVTDYIKYRLSQHKTTAVIALRAVPDEARTDYTGETMLRINVTSATTVGAQAGISFTFSDPSLSGIQLDGTALESFLADQTSYTVNLADGAVLPTVTATAVEAGTNIVVSDPVAGERNDYTVTITSTGKDGNVKTYTVKFQYPYVYAQGTFSVKDAERIQYDAYPNVNSISVYGVGDKTFTYIRARCNTNNRLDYKEAAILRFDMTNVEGLNEDDRILLTFRASTVADQGTTINRSDYTYVKVTGVSNESWTYNDTTNVPLIDESVLSSTTEGNIPVYGSYKEFQIDVTDYIKAKIAAGATTVTFAFQAQDSTNIAAGIYLEGTHAGALPTLTYAKSE